MQWSKYNSFWIKDDCLYIYNSIHNKLAIIDNTTTINENSDINELTEQGFLVDNPALENDLAHQSIRQKLHTSDEFSCWIFITNDCNLACPYCFEKDTFLNKEIKYLDEESCIQVVSWILNKAREKNVQKIHISITGGEPLLNQHAITTIAQHLLDTEFEVSINIITNGVLLTQNVMEKLFNLGISSYQITLDGTSRLHDARRFFKDGKGTFSVIIQNIINILRLNTDIQFVIRINIDKQNCEETDNLLLFLKKIHFEKSVIICINDTITQGPCNSSSMLEKNTELIAKAIDYGFKIAFGELNNCWMMSEFWYMIDVDGSLYKCPSLVGDKKYQVGSIFSDDMLPQHQQQTALKPWEDCMNCELVGLCSGGCPYRSLLNKGDWNTNKVCRKNYLKSLLELKYSN